MIYLFLKDCKDRFYGRGSDCEDSCGHCKDNKTCNTDKGYCSGCDVNFQEPFCKGTLNQFTPL